MTDKKFKDCPFCAEEIKTAAIKCKHCKSFLDETHLSVNENTTATTVKNNDVNITGLPPENNKGNDPNQFQKVANGKKSVNYCRNCGSAIKEGQYVCASCGFAPINGYHHCQQCSTSTKQGQKICTMCGFELLDVMYKSKEEPATGMALVGFVLPILGLILYLVWNESRPGKANSALTGAIVGLVVGFFVWLTVFLGGAW